MHESEAIQRLKRGDITGLAPLVEAHQVKAVRTAILITRDRALAEDVVQTVFIRAYEKIHQFDGSRPFGPWFLKSVVNEAVRAAKKEQRTIHFNGHHDEPDQTGVILEALPAETPGPSAVMEENELKETVQTALEQLSPDQRAAIVMRYYLDMTEEDMASVAEVPSGTIKWRLHAARKRLKGLLDMLRKPADKEVNAQ